MALSVALGAANVPTEATVTNAIGRPANLINAAEYLNRWNVIRARSHYVFRTRQSQTQTTMQWNLSDGIMRYNLIPILGVRARIANGYPLNSDAHAVVVRYVLSDRSMFGLRDPWAPNNAAGIVDRNTAQLWGDFSAINGGLIF